MTAPASTLPRARAAQSKVATADVGTQARGTGLTIALLRAQGQVGKVSNSAAASAAGLTSEVRA